MRLIAVAGDAGGARAVAPVVRELLRRGHDVECRAYGPATAIWASDGLRVAEAPGAARGASAAVLGTSVNAEQRELELIEAARREGVRTVSVLDSWVHYRERFVGRDARLHLPDAIAVPDDVARGAAAGSGLPADRLVVTGQPAFDELAAVAENASALRAATRRRLAIGEETLVLFASQPLELMYETAELGFDPKLVLADVVRALAGIARRRDRGIRLLVKLHPREMGSAYGPPASPSDRLRIDVAGDDAIHPRDLVVAADLVVGMNSILLLEACLLRVPTVSYQPGIRIADPLPTNDLGWSASVRDPALLGSTLEDELFEPRARERRREILAGARISGGSARRVADLVLAHLSS